MKLENRNNSLLLRRKFKINKIQIEGYKKEKAAVGNANYLIVVTIQYFSI